jgi:hypothetical protein
MSDPGQDRNALLAHRLEGEPDQQRHEQRLQHVALGQRRDQRVRDQVEQEVRARLGLTFDLGLSGLLRRLGQVQAGTGLDEVADHQADPERKERHRQEVAEGQSTDLADAGCLAHRSDAQHDRAEDDRGDDHLDQVDERRAERFEPDRETLLAREREANRDARQHRDNHRHVEILRLVARGLLRGRRGFRRCGARQRCRGRTGHGVPPGLTMGCPDHCPVPDPGQRCVHCVRGRTPARSTAKHGAGRSIRRHPTSAVAKPHPEQAAHCVTCAPI